VQQQRACRAFELFRASDIEPVLIKGLAASRFYPDDVLRESIDMDLAVAASDYGRATALIRQPEFDGLAIDLHRELRHLDSVPWNDLSARSQLIETPFGELRMLCPEDHLRVLCVHWLMDGGTSRDRLWDIYYAIENRGPEFRWDTFLDTVPDNRRRWLVCTLGVTAKYLGLDLAGTPVETDARELPAWLTDTLERQWEAGLKDEPLEVAMHSPARFVRLLGQKLHQNPIWATVQMNGSFDAPTRIHYKAGLFFYRIPDSVRRLAATAWNRRRES
jgi:hypothetical protein